MLDKVSYTTPGDRRYEKRAPSHAAEDGRVHAGPHSGRSTLGIAKRQGQAGLRAAPRGVHRVMLGALAVLFGAVFTVAVCTALGRLLLGGLRLRFHRQEEFLFAL